MKNDRLELGLSINIRQPISSLFHEFHNPKVCTMGQAHYGRIKPGIQSAPWGRGTIPATQHFRNQISAKAIQSRLISCITENIGTKQYGRHDSES